MLLHKIMHAAFINIVTKYAARQIHPVI